MTLASGRKADRPWVDQMVGKHSNLPTDKLVLVSKAGFSKPALYYAATHKAEAVTFEAAEAVDWGAYIEQLRSMMVGLFHLSGKPTTLWFKKLRAEDPDLVLDMLPDEYRNAADGRKGTWDSFISAILRAPDAGLTVMREWLVVSNGRIGS